MFSLILEQACHPNITSTQLLQASCTVVTDKLACAFCMEKAIKFVIFASLCSVMVIAYVVLACASSSYVHSQVSTCVIYTTATSKCSLNLRDSENRLYR